MRRILGLITAVMISVAVMAQGGQSGQDFAAKFVEQCGVDTAVQCVTISPKMMEQLTRQADAVHSEHIAQAIQKLKGARIVTTSVNGSEYYRRAEDLLKKNPQRFRRTDSYHNDRAQGTFYVRQTKSGETVEMILLHNDTKAGTLVVVNLTGSIDDEFVDSIMKHFGARAARN